MAREEGKRRHEDLGDPFPTLGSYRKMPHYSFGGNGVPRDDFITHTVNTDSPGPGSEMYEPPSHGFQPLSTKRSAPTHSIGKMKRPDFFACENVSPGPAAVNLMGTATSGPKGCTFHPFETATRLPLWANNPPPGPGDYELQAALGRQASSRYPTLPISKFGSQHRAEYRKLWGGSAELTVRLAQTPGVKYAHQQDAFGDEPQYTIRPWTSFGSMYEPAVRAEAEAAAEETLSAAKQMKKLTTTELIGNRKKVELNKSIAQELATFPRNKPLPPHLRRKDSRQSNQLKWGFRDSGFHRGADDDDLEERVKYWAAAERSQHTTTMQRIDVLDRTRNQKKKKKKRRR